MSRQRQKPSVWSAVRESWRRTTTRGKHPAWCDSTHETRYHDGEVGSVQMTHAGGGVNATNCPRWCDGSHPVLYHCAGEGSSDRDHFREIGRVNDGGSSVIVVGIAQSSDAGDHQPAVHVLHLSDDGADVPEICCGEAYLTAAEARAIAPLLVRAAEIVEADQ